MRLLCAAVDRLACHLRCADGMHDTMGQFGLADLIGTLCSMSLPAKRSQAALAVTSLQQASTDDEDVSWNATLSGHKAPQLTFLACCAHIPCGHRLHCTFTGSCKTLAHLASCAAWCDGAAGGQGLRSCEQAAPAAAQRPQRAATASELCAVPAPPAQLAPPPAGRHVCSLRFLDPH